VNAESHSTSALLVQLLRGPVRKGTALDRHDFRVGDYVVTLTAPHKPRMPNGVECPVWVAKDSRISIGRGRIIVGRFELEPGPGWDPVPAVGHFEVMPPGPQPLASWLATWVSDPSHSADAMLCGYVAGLVLLHGMRKRAEAIALRSAGMTDPLSGTLLRHASMGEVPEPVHGLLMTGDPAPLLAFDDVGILWLRGLVSAGFPLDPSTKLLSKGPRTLASQLQ
jgi:hypothetical protein